MRFVATEIPGAFVVELEPLEDERGMFARAFCAEECAAHGVAFDAAQANMAVNVLAGTVRGLHRQDERAPEAKFFRCIRGRTYHVAVDLRPDSPAYLRHVGVELSAESRRAFLVPPLCAAGYQALTPGAEILYLASAPYAPEAEDGVRHDDPALGIEWPLEPVAVSAKDRGWPLLADRVEVAS